MESDLHNIIYGSDNKGHQALTMKMCVRNC